MAEYKKSKSVWIIYVLIAVVVYAIIALVYFQPQQPARQAEITASSQGIANDNVLIDSVFLDKPGFVVVHKADNGRIGAVIGNSGLITGARTDVAVQIDASQAGTRVFAMLHYDNGDGVYTIADEDSPAVLAGNVVVKPVDVIATAEPAPSPVASAAPSCWTCAPEKYSAWIGDATCDAGCGETFGPGNCHSDACVVATPSPTPTPTATPTPSPVPVIGGGGY